MVSADRKMNGALSVVTEFDLAGIVEDAGYRDGGIIAIAVVNGDGLISRYERGVLTDGLPMTCDTLVYGASLTKQIVAMCAARLVQAGLIDPTSSITTWLPGLVGLADDVQFRHLVHHTAGFPDEATLVDRMGDEGGMLRTSEGMLAALASFRSLDRAPGDSFDYSNIGYVCLGRIVELVSGTALAEHVDEIVFRPLGMGRTRLWSGPGVRPEGGSTLDPDSPVPLSLGDGGMWTTANDLARWIRAMNADTFGVRDLMMIPGALNDESALDYAWAVRVTDRGGVNVCSHGGGWPGSISRMAWIPERTSGFIAFTVDGGPPLENLFATLLATLTSS